MNAIHALSQLSYSPVSRHLKTGIRDWDRRKRTDLPFRWPALQFRFGALPRLAFVLLDVGIDDAADVVFFVLAGAAKLADLDAFEKAVRDYRILPGWLVRPMARLLPATEVAAGVLMAPGLPSRP